MPRGPPLPRGNPWTCYHRSMNRLSKWEIFYSFLIILPMAAAMTIGDYILRKRAIGND
jgi:hypothetical protein